MITMVIQIYLAITVNLISYTELLVISCGITTLTSCEGVPGKDLTQGILYAGLSLL
jgi:hypothetical protein